ncbi:MAG: hypothetical protein PHW50_01900 [Patescibacteria group bacterium]|nr:hypothetical protein [Patescibacteria group bacterium]
MELQEIFLTIKKQNQGSFLFVGKVDLEDFKIMLFDNLFDDKNAILFDFVQSETDAVKDIREALNKMDQKSIFGLRVFFLPNFSNLSKIIQNTLLKRLEEVKKGEIYILQTDSTQGILNTILSRCQKINLAYQDQESVEPFFIAQHVDLNTWWQNKPKSLNEMRDLLENWVNFKGYKNEKQREIIVKNYILVKKINVSIDLFWLNLYANLITR